MTATGLAAYADRATPDILAASLDRRFKRHPHIRLIALAIVEALFDPNIDCVIIRTPPRVGKSTIVNWVIVWLLDWFPTLPIITTSYAIRLSRRNSRRIRNIFTTFARRLRTAIAKDQQAAEQWETVDGGGLLASAVRAALSGFDAAVVFIDDPHKSWAEAQSDVVRDGTWDWFESEAESRLMAYDVEVGAATITIHPTIVIVHTAFHPDDLSHRAEAKYSAIPNPDTGELENRCRIVHIPALADPDIVDPDPLGRQPGESICEPMHPARGYRRRRASTNPYIWAALWQGVPRVIDGGVVHRDWWAWADSAPDPDRRLLTYTSWDLTFKEDGTSWVVGQLWAVTRWPADPNKLQFHLLDQIRRQEGFVGQRLMVRAFAESHRLATRHVIEDAANGAAIVDDLRLPWVDTQAYDDSGRRVPAGRASRSGKRWPAVTGLSPVKPAGSKLDRLIKVSTLVADGQVVLPGWWEPSDEPRYPGDAGDKLDLSEAWGSLINECAEVPNATNDDQADALSQAVSWGLANIPSLVEGGAQDRDLMNPPRLRRPRRR